jgi:serine/threonine-protein phosphatase 5
MSEEANSLKAEGNNAFRAKKYFDAFDFYTKALEKCSQDDKSLLVSIYLNLSYTEIFLEKTSEAVDHASAAIELDPTNVKAYYRRGQAKVQSLDLEGAYKDYVQALKINPAEKKIRQEAENARGIIKRRELIKAMSVQEGDSIQKIEAKEYVPEPSNVEIPEFNKEYAMKMIEDLKKDIRPHKDIFRAMLKAVKALNEKMQNIVELSPKGKFYVVGDTHGQFQDVLALFEKFGYPTREHPFLFNGDYVDRGSMGIEILCTLMAIKLADPESIYLNRGNHETLYMNQMYGFEKECTSKYNSYVYQECSDMFNTLPLGHLLNKKVLIVHGGLFTDETLTIEDIQKLNRFRQPPETGPINDILWSDPMEQNGLAPSPRGLTRTFGPDISKKFCERLDLDFIIRSHQVMQDGISEMHNGKCITVFSAPNYVGQMGNKGAVVSLDFDEDGKLKEKAYEKYTAMPIPKKYPPMMYASFGNFC